MYYLEFFSKKAISLLLILVLFLSIIPTTNAAKWYVSSIDKTYFEIPPDDRNLRDFVFGNQVINYKKWSDDSNSWSSMEATITANMMWYKTTFNSNPTEGLKVITNEDISTFFVVVNNFFYKPDGTFAFPLRDYNENYMYMYWKLDEDQNHCLYLDLNNKGTEVYKIKHTCHMKLYDRDPFLLFFQVGRTGYDSPHIPSYSSTSWYISSEENIPNYKISVTTTHKAKYKEKDYITFNVPEVFHLDTPEFNNYGYLKNNIFTLSDGKYVSNTLESEKFLRKGNQRAFRPYSFYFEKDLLKRYDEINEDEKLKAKHCNSNDGYCQITSPFDYTSFFESFVLSVAAQYYNSPAVKNDNNYIEAPDGIEGGGFQPYNECSGFLDVGCHISNVGVSISNGFKMFLNGFIEGIKGIFSFILDSIKGFFEPIIKPIFEPIIKPIYDFLKGIFDFFISNLNDLKNISFTGTMNTCTDFMEVNTENATITSNLVNLISLAIPVPPANNSEICTLNGKKVVKYQQNTKLLDTIFILVCFSGIIFTFISGSKKDA